MQQATYDTTTSKKLKRLEEDAATKLMASSSIPSFHNVVEELVLNSIDAGATSIHVSVNISSASLDIEVRDNGQGIGKVDMELSIGELHHTSKTLYGHYGMKGQALASLRQLATAVHVYSTIVRVMGLFHPFPVRKQAVRSTLEILLIQDFINNIPSVAKRLTTLHSDMVMTKLHPFAYTDGGYSIEGLLSYPCREDCSITRDCQYMFANNRWLRNRDALSKFLNDTFSKALAENWNYGPSAKHVKVNHAKYPKYVIKFVCPQTELDLLVEPDKTVPIFADENKILAFVRKALLSFSSGRYAAFDAVLTHSVENSSPVTSKTMGEIQRHDSVGIGPVATSNMQHTASMHLTAPSSSSRHNLFTSAFLFADDDVPSFPLKDYPRSNQISPKPSMSVFVQRTAKECPLPTDKSNIFGMARQNMQNLHNASDDDNKIPMRTSSDEESVWGVARPITQNIEETMTKPSSIDTIQYHTSAVKAHDSSEVEKPAPFSLSVDFMDRFQQVERNHSPSQSLFAITAFTSLTSSSVPEEVSLKKDILGDLHVIGQWDNKFILCRATMTDIKDNLKKVLLLALDQHAVDERINYEQIIANIENSVDGVAVTNISSMIISYNEREIYLQQRSAFQRWCFDYDFDKGGHNAIMVKMIPKVLGEQLSLEDMREFNHYIFQNFELPPCRWIPPAVMRIAASKACRSSIKFGTPLSEEKMKHMITLLASTNQPFQCAHGRPSLVPLMQFPTTLSSHASIWPTTSCQSCR